MHRYCLLRLATLACLLLLCVTGVLHATDTPHNNETSFLARSGFPGMCRGVIHVLSAPIMIPYGLVYGAAAPFSADPELNGSTNYITYAVVSTLTAPLTLAANTGVGAGGCGIELFSGLMDIFSFGHYNLPHEDSEAPYDARPFFLQALLHKDGPGALFARPSSAPQDTQITSGTPPPFLHVAGRTP